MKLRLIRFLILICAFVLPMMAQAHTHNANSKTESSAVAGVKVGGAFSLTDHKGNAVTEKSWPGRYKVVFFGFTSCPDACPAGLAKIAAVMENFDPKGEKIVPLFVTTDPERDTKEVMADYVAKFNLNIIGLTGTSEQIRQMVSTYKVYASGIDHSVYIYLMSPEDELLKLFHTGDTVDGMVSNLKELVKSR